MEILLENRPLVREICQRVMANFENQKGQDILRTGHTLIKINALALEGFFDFAKYEAFMNSLAEYFCSLSDEIFKYFLYTITFRAVNWPEHALNIINERLLERRQSDSPSLFSLDTFFDHLDMTPMQAPPKGQIEMPEEFLQIQNFNMRAYLFINIGQDRQTSTYFHHVKYLSFERLCSPHSMASFKFVSKFVFFQDDLKCLQTSVLFAVGMVFYKLSEGDSNEIILRIREHHNPLFVKRAIIGLLLMAIKNIPISKLIWKYQKVLKESFKEKRVLYLFLDYLGEYLPLGSTEDNACLVSLLFESGIMKPGMFYEYLFEKIQIKVYSSHYEYALNFDWMEKAIQKIRQYQLEGEIGMISILTRCFIWADEEDQRNLPIVLGLFSEHAFNQLSKDAMWISNEALDNVIIIHPRVDYILRQLAQAYEDDPTFISEFDSNFIIPQSEMNRFGISRVSLKYLGSSSRNELSTSF